MEHVTYDASHLLCTDDEIAESGQAVSAAPQHWLKQRPSLGWAGNPYSGNCYTRGLDVIRQDKKGKA
jgi:hypothetical protein